MRHTYECPLRWADLDLLGHVNNVTYIDYLQEARIDMFAEHPGFRGGADLAEGVVVVRHEVDFVRRCSFRRTPVLVDSWVTQVRAGSFEMAYEVYDEDPEDGPDGQSSTCARRACCAPFVFATESPRALAPAEREFLERYLEPRARPERLSGSGVAQHVYALRVRWTRRGRLPARQQRHLLRVLPGGPDPVLLGLHRQGRPGPSTSSPAPTSSTGGRSCSAASAYDVHSWVSRVGTRSFEIAAQIRDGARCWPVARSVMVTFDKATQRAAQMPPTSASALDAGRRAASRPARPELDRRRLRPPRGCSP